MNTKQTIKEKLQYLAELAKTGENDADQASQEAFGKIIYAYVTGYLQSRLGTISMILQQVLDEMEEE